MGFFGPDGRCSGPYGPDGVRVAGAPAPWQDALMTNRVAIALGLAILGFVAWDLIQNSGEALLFLAKRLDKLIEWLAFWR